MKTKKSPTRRMLSAADELRRIASHEPSVIFVRLTQDDRDRFHAAHVGYSGAGDYGGSLGFGIATMGRSLHEGCATMGWTRMKVKISGKQWLVRRYRASGRS